VQDVLAVAERVDHLRVELLPLLSTISRRESRQLRASR
jgi:hypothetical protein